MYWVTFAKSLRFVLPFIFLNEKTLVNKVTVSELATLTAADVMTVDQMLMNNNSFSDSTVDEQLRVKCTKSTILG